MDLQDCRQIVSRIAPELSNCYLIETDTFTAPSDAGAFSIRGPHQESQRYLEQRGEWDDWKTGFIVFIEPPSLGNLLHEAAHLVPAKVIAPRGIDKPTLWGPRRLAPGGSTLKGCGHPVYGWKSL